VEAANPNVTAMQPNHLPSSLMFVLQGFTEQMTRQELVQFLTPLPKAIEAQLKAQDNTK
jgi:hypothetical protein